MLQSMSKTFQLGISLGQNADKGKHSSLFSQPESITGLHSKDRLLDVPAWLCCYKLFLNDNFTICDIILNLKVSQNSSFEELGMQHGFTVAIHTKEGRIQVLAG